MNGGMLPIGDLSVVNGTGVEGRAVVARGPRDVAHGAFLAMFARIVAGTAAGESRSQVDPSSLTETAETAETVETVETAETADRVDTADTVHAEGSAIGSEAGVAVENHIEVELPMRGEGGWIPPDGAVSEAGPESPPLGASADRLAGTPPDSRAVAFTRPVGVVSTGDPVAEADPRDTEPTGGNASRRLTPSGVSEAPPVIGSSRATTADPARSERSLDLLDADFRVRLEQVIARMEREYGHRVSIVETFRHQDRQDHLFAQGRTRPGEIVTWTRNSNHTHGTAADVIIDGSYGNPTAYARLRQVAAQEGLSGLGARDPGHLELPSSVRPPVTDDGADAVLARGPADAEWRVTARAAEGRAPARVIPAGELAQPAPVAAVARVATVEAPRIAAVAVPGRVSGSPSEQRSREADRVPFPTGPASIPAALPSDVTATPANALVTPDALRFGETTEPLAARAITSASAERIAHLLDLDSSTPLKPLHQVLLRLEGAAGEDRIRLELQGNSVGATIDAGDQLTADRLDNHLGELRRALERQGLEADALQVRSRVRGEGQNLTGATAAADLDPLRISGQKASGEHVPRERPHPEARDETRDQARQELANRNRSRREQKGDQNT